MVSPINENKYVISYQNKLQEKNEFKARTEKIVHSKIDSINQKQKKIYEDCDSFHSKIKDIRKNAEQLLKELDDYQNLSDKSIL